MPFTLIIVIAVCVAQALSPAPGATEAAGDVAQLAQTSGHLLETSQVTQVQVQAAGAKGPSVKEDPIVLALLQLAEAKATVKAHQNFLKGFGAHPSHAESCQNLGRTAQTLFDAFSGLKVTGSGSSTGQAQQLLTRLESFLEHPAMRNLQSLRVVVARTSWLADVKVPE